MKIRLVCLATCGAFLLMAGCRQNQGPGMQEPRVSLQGTDFARGVRHDVTEWTREGLGMSREGPPKQGYVFYVLLRQYLGEPMIKYAVLKEGYGMMIRCDGSSSETRYPVPHFELFSATCGLIARTADMANFKQRLAQIPRGETLREFDTCGGGLHYGMDPNVAYDIEGFCRQKGIRYVSSMDGGIICTCF